MEKMKNTNEQVKCFLAEEKLRDLELESRLYLRKHQAWQHAMRDLNNLTYERQAQRMLPEGETVPANAEEAEQVLVRYRELTESLIPEALQELQRARQAMRRKFVEVNLGEYKQRVADASEAVAKLVCESDVERGQCVNFLAKVGAPGSHPAVLAAVGKEMQLSDRIEKLIDKIPALRLAREQQRHAQIERAVESLRAAYAKRAAALAEALFLFSKAEQTERESRQSFLAVGVDDLPATLEPDSVLLIGECLRAAVEHGLLPADALPAEAQPSEEIQEETAV